MSKDDLRDRVDAEKDFVAVGHHKHSLKAIRARYPDGAPDHVVAKAMGRTEAQVRSMYAVAVRTLRKIMGVTPDE